VSLYCLADSYQKPKEESEPIQASAAVDLDSACAALACLNLERNSARMSASVTRTSPVCVARATVALRHEGPSYLDLTARLNALRWAAMHMPRRPLTFTTPRASVPDEKLQRYYDEKEAELKSVLQTLGPEAKRTLLARMASESDDYIREDMEDRYYAALEKEKTAPAAREPLRLDPLESQELARYRYTTKNGKGKRLESRPCVEGFSANPAVNPRLQFPPEVRARVNSARHRAAVLHRRDRAAAMGLVQVRATLVTPAPVVVAAPSPVPLGSTDPVATSSVTAAPADIAPMAIDAVAPVLAEPEQCLPVPTIQMVRSP
jgi:hypothetical protein